MVKSWVSTAVVVHDLCSMYHTKGNKIMRKVQIISSHSVEPYNLRGAGTNEYYLMSETETKVDELYSSCALPLDKCTPDYVHVILRFQ